MALSPEIIGKSHTFCSDCGTHSDVFFTSQYEDYTEEIEKYINDPVKLAEKFHEYYESLAPSYGYTTRKDTKKFDPNTPNGKLMIAVCGKILDLLFPDSLNE